MPILPISVIICAKNAESVIEDCLKSARDNDPAEIIVIDGLSTDGTVEIAREFTDLIHSDEGKGTSYAHQLGAEKATQKYIAYIDADVVSPPGALATMLDELERLGYAAIEAQIRAAKLSNYWERTLQAHTEIILSRKKALVGLMATLLERNTVLEHGFDPSISIAGDDLDFIMGLKRAGGTFGFSSAHIYHVHRADFRSFARQRYRNGRGRAQFARKHGLFDPAMWPPLTTVYMLGYCLIRGKLRLIPYFLLGGIIETAGIVKGFFELTGKDRR